MSIISTTVACDFPGCPEILTLREGVDCLDDFSWKVRDYDGSDRHLCRAHGQVPWQDLRRAMREAATPIATVWGEV